MRAAGNGLWLKTVKITAASKCAQRRKRSIMRTLPRGVAGARLHPRRRVADDAIECRIADMPPDLNQRAMSTG